MFQPSPFNAAGGRRRSRRAVLWLENKQFCYKNYNHLSSREGLEMNDESSAEIKAGRCLVALCVIAFLGEVAKPALQASAELTTQVDV